MQNPKEQTSGSHRRFDLTEGRAAGALEKRYLLGVFLIVWFLCFFHFNPSKLGTDRFVYVMMSLVERGTLRIDPYAGEMKDKVAVAGHVYSDVNPGLALMAAPEWAIVVRVYGNVSRLDEATHYALAHFVGFAASTALLSALGSAFLFALIYDRTRNIAWAWLVTLLHAIGSINFYFSTFMHNSASIAALTLMWFVAVYAPEAVLIKNPHTRWGLAGFVLGFMLLVDIGSIALCAVMICLTLRKMPLGEIARALSVFLVSVCVLCVCQYLAFHNPFLPAQAYMAKDAANAHAHGFWGIVLPRPAYLLGMFLSPSVGLFLFMPYTVIVFGFLLRPGKDALIRREERFTVWVIFVAQWLFVGGGVVFQDQFGPRYLLPPLALLDVAFGLCALAKVRAFHKATVILCLLSVLVNVAGAQIGVATNSVFRSVAVWLLRGPWLPLYTFITEARSRSPQSNLYPVTPYAAFLLLAVILWLISRFFLQEPRHSVSAE